MTIYDIAKEANVSASTVSRVINDKPGVNKKNRELVLTLLKKYRYVPNEAARGLVTSSSKMIGILIVDVRTQHYIEGAYYIANELTKHGYCSLILNTGGSDEEQSAGIRTLMQHRVEAVVLMGSIFQSKGMQHIIANTPDVPFFMLNGYLDLPNVYAVLSDERSGVADCVALLGKKKKHRIAFLVDTDTPSSRLKTQGFRDGMAALNARDKECWVYSGVEGSYSGAFEVTQRLLQEHPKVDGIICSLDLIGCGALRALHEAGKKVPGDVAVIGIDNSVYAEISSPSLTSLDNMIFDSGISIAHKLIDCLEGRGGNKKAMLFTKIIERETT